MEDMTYEELCDAIRTEIIRMYYEKSPGCLTKDCLSRKMQTSPILGAYGIQGYSLAIDGTPPRGTIIVFTHNKSYRIFFWDDSRNFKDLRNARHKYIRFCKMIEKWVDYQEKIK